ncbi:signal recognition particle [Candidatus Bathyarchaeota archaeon ex4484_135]|nr:MAG: signal recognition particle [Candidatus Bathyarchaeota archaeon ex4484_135]
MRKRKGMCVVWPVYFDLNESRKLRRVPKELAITSPKLEEICRALDILGLRYEVVSGAAHPSRHWEKTGYLLVEKREPKEQLMRKIASLLKRIKARARRKV